MFTKGNKMIFLDLHWQHLAYFEKGISEVESLYKSGDMPKSARDAWVRIDAGVKKGARTEEGSKGIWEGNMLLLKHEQATIQKDLYDAYPAIWKWVKDNPRTADVRSPVPGDEMNFRAFTGKGADLSDFDQRWSWIENSMFPAFKDYDAQQNGSMVKQLNEFASMATELRNKRTPYWPVAGFMPPEPSDGKMEQYRRLWESYRKNVNALKPELEMRAWPQRDQK